MDGSHQYKLQVPLIWPDVWNAYNYHNYLLDLGQLDGIYSFADGQPDCDVFFPITSRYLRGWYILKPWPAPPPSVLPDAYCYHPPPTASSLPPELFDRIVQSIAHPGRRSLKTDDKRAISACALVCRHWTAKWQKRLFSRVRLRSREDWLTLHALLISPNSHISQYIYYVDITIDAPTDGDPWIHLPWLFFGQLGLKRRMRFIADVQGPLKSTQGQLRSIYGPLPRPPPRFFSALSLSTIRLNDIRFVRLNTLIHLVEEHAPVRWLACTRVNWDILPTGLPAARRTSMRTQRAGVNNYRTVRPSDYSIKICDCTSPWSQATIWLSTRYIDTEEIVYGLVALSRIIDACCTNTPPGIQRHSVWRVNPQRISLVIYLDWCEETLWKEQTLTIRFETRETKELTQPRVLEVDSIAFNLIPLCKQPDVAANVACEMVKAVGVSFPNVRTLTLAFPSKESISDFLRDGSEDMSRLSNATEVRFALWNPAGTTLSSKSGSWLTVSRDLQSTEDTHNTSLGDVDR